MVGFGLGWIGCEGGEEVGKRGSGKAKDFVGRMGAASKRDGGGSERERCVRVRAAKQVSRQFWYGTSSRVQQQVEQECRGEERPRRRGQQLAMLAMLEVGGWQRLPKGKLQWIPLDWPRR